MKAAFQALFKTRVPKVNKCLRSVWLRVFCHVALLVLNTSSNPNSGLLCSLT